MNVSKELIALEFLKKLVRGGPFKNRVFLAGGAVRDMEMGFSPKDLDVVVTGDLNSGMEFARWATRTMGNFKDGSNPVSFPKYGTSKFTLNGITHDNVDLSDVDVEAVATRKEKYTHGSRKPEVSAGELIDDCFRRDFNVNSLMLDLTTGEVLDLTGLGKEDIKNGVVRTTSDPDIIFKDDPLRIMRCIRFTFKYNWKLSMNMIRALKRNASQLEHISSERITDELNKIILTDNVKRAFRLMRITGILDAIMPEFVDSYDMTQNHHHDETVFAHILSVVETTPKVLITRYMALFHDIGKTKTKTIGEDGRVHFYSHENVSFNMVKTIMTRLKYNNEMINSVSLGVLNHMRLKSAGKCGSKISDKSIRKFVVDVGDNINYILDLIHSDNVCHSPESAMPDQIPIIVKRIELLKNTIPKKNEKLPVTGKDLIELGLKPGPIFNKLLELVKDKRLENPNTTRDEYIELINSNIKND
jgi:poly(A) polymerase